MKCLYEQPKLQGKTAVVVDVSYSMTWSLSERSDMNRLDAACGLAMCVREMCDDVAIYSFSERNVRIPDRHGFALRDSICSSQQMSGTYLAGAIRHVNKDCDYDRIIVITDEQSHDGSAPPIPDSKAYMLNVATYEHGVGYGQWTHISGFSESILSYINEIEKL